MTSNFVCIALFIPLQLSPVIASPTHYLFQIVREGITFLACTQVEMPPLMGIEVSYLFIYLFLTMVSMVMTVEKYQWLVTVRLLDVLSCGLFKTFVLIEAKFSACIF